MDTFITILIFLIILTVLVLVHEAGHFFVARKAGIRVEEFGIGLPPKIWGRKYGETEYTINLLPIGGFVRMHGESPDGVSIQDEHDKKSQAEADRTFMAKSKLARTAVLLAGVTANLILGIIIFTIVFTVGLPQFAAKPEVSNVVQDSPAADAGFKEGQTIVALNGEAYEEIDGGFSAKVIEKSGEPVTITVEDASGNQQDLTVTPRQDPPAGQGALGITIGGGEIFVASTEKYPIYQAWWEGIKEALNFSWQILATLGGMVGGLVSTGTAPADLAGPVGIAGIVGQARELGWIPVLFFAGIISINLAVVNVLPFPALDGGRLVFVAYEAITRRKANPNVERWVNTIGMLVLLGLILLITISDIRKLF